MIYSKLYKIDTSDTEWHIAHLFEHLVINGFYAMLAKKHIQPHLISWLNGESFEGVLFVTSLFYTKELADEFDAYIKNLPSFTKNSILHTLATIQSEEKSILSINDWPTLFKELNRLRKRQWNIPADVEDHRNIPHPTTITEERSTQNFRDIIIITKSENLTLDEQKLYLRAHTLLRDIINGSLASLEGFYLSNDSTIGRHGEHMAFILKYTTPRGTTLKQVQNVLDSLYSSNVADLEMIVKVHFSAFSNEPSWQDLPIEYYRLTGIATTNQEIARLANVSRMQSILKKTFIEVRQMTSEYESLLQ